MLNRKRSDSFHSSATAGPTLKIPSLTAIGISTLVPFGLALGPFIWLGQLDQLGKRLFPFTRGLMHAYWAPKWVSIYASRE